MNRILKGYRNMLGMNQTEMGKIIGTSKANYCAKETGRYEFKYNEMLKILKIVNKKFPAITMGELFAKEE